MHVDKLPLLQITIEISLSCFDNMSGYFFLIFGPVEHEISGIVTESSTRNCFMMLDDSS